MSLLLSLFVLTQLLADLFKADLSLAPGLSVKNAFLYVLMLALALRFVLARRHPIELLSIPLCFVSLIAYASISIVMIAIVADYPEFSLKDTIISLKAGLVDHLIFFLVFFYGVTAFKDALRVLHTLLLGMVLINVLTIVDVLFGNLGVIEHFGPTRIVGAFGDANETATVLVTFFPAMVAEMVSGRRWMRVLWGGGLLTSLAVLVMTASRGGFFAIIAAGVFGVFWLRRFFSLATIARSALIIGACSFVTVAVLGVQFKEMLSGRLLGGTFEVGLTEASSGRTEIWAAALSKMFAEPWSMVTGFGWSGYDSMPFLVATHSEYLHFWFDLGIPGVCLFVLILVQPMLIARRAVPRAKGLVRAHLLAFLFGTMALMWGIAFVNLFGVWGYIWAYIGIVMRLAMTALHGASESAVAPQPSVAGSQVLQRKHEREHRGALPEDRRWIHR